MAPNPHISNRLPGIQKMLMGAHEAGSVMTSESRGEERQAFVGNFLEQVLPLPYRFGKGDATDTNGNRSGQLDVVVEYPFLPSLPVVGPGSSRLYLAEGIVAVVEVKSNLNKQWNEVLTTANKLAALKRIEFASLRLGGELPVRIPFFVAGYEGWKTVETVRQHFNDAPIDGILVIEPPGIFVGAHDNEAYVCTGADSLWGLVSLLTLNAQKIGVGSFNPFEYIQSPSVLPPEI